ncbi:MAG: LAGLIDADG family homing endonuclease [Patescibacteria group bacterium]
MSKEKLAYIAGFLDGDGCVMLQLVSRHDYVYGYQIRASIVFYQKTKHRQFLEWLKEELVDGYIRNRKDGMTEYAIVGPKPVTRILKQLKPHLRLKKEHAAVALQVLSELPSGRQITPKILLELARQVDRFKELNYSKKRTNTSRQVYEFLLNKNLLNPVETDS